jgi:hypothetical protein
MAALMYFAGWVTNRLPLRVARLMPEPVLRAAYRQLWREWAEQ